MTTLRDKKQCIRIDEFQLHTKFDYEDVKEAVLTKNKNIKNRISYLKQLDNNKIFAIEAVITFFEEELKENKQILGDFEEEKQK